MTKKISQLPAATSVDTNDEFVINQDGTTKKLTTANPWQFSNVNIDGGNIDGTAIGASSASSGAFTTLTASDDVNFDSGTLFVDASANNVGIGTTSPIDSLTASFGSRSIGIEGGLGSEPSPAFTNLNFRGFNRNRTASIQSYDQSSTRAYSGGLEFFVNNNMANDTLQSALWLDGFGHAIIPAGVTLGTSAGVYNAANTLDDYETGTWTPGFESASGSFGTLVFSTRVGYYTKVGNLVTVYGRTDCSATNIGTASGEIFINNLPFASANVSGSLVAAGTAVRPGGPGPAVAGAGMIVNQTRFYLEKSGGGSVQVSDLVSGGRNDFAWTITYAV